jgi:crossover junction endodeoxyribonuclease RusA
MITFFVPGIPVAKGSARAFVVKGRAIVSQTNAAKQKPWASLISTMAVDAGVRLIERGPAFVDLAFVMPRPKSHYRGKAMTLRDDAPHYHASKPDADKLLRLVLDSLTGIAYIDDAQVQVRSAEKVYGTSPGVWVRIWDEIYEDGP